MEIREALPADGSAIASVYREGAAYYADLAPDLFQVPEEKGLVAFIPPRPEDNSEADRFEGNADLAKVRLFIHGLSVRRDRWRQGVATALVDAAEVWGRERGAAIALCDTWVDSPLSLPFWRQRMGYRPRAVRLRKPLAD